MAKGSKKGACSAHVSSAKANCLNHNRREGYIPSYVNPHLSHTNRVVYEDEMIRGKKSITPLVRAAEKLYTQKTGQKCQKTFAPFREDVLRIKAGITDEQLLKFKDKVEKETGWRVVGIWLHQDEGHAHSKYIEGDDKFDINYHAHVLYSCQDQETGKALRLGRDYFRLRQDWLAEATGMERGNKASETGRRHRNAMQQRIEAEEERLSNLSVAAAARESAVETIKGVGAAVMDAVRGRRKKAMSDVIREIVKAAGFKVKGELTPADVGKSWRREFDKAQKAANLTRKLDETVQRTENLQNALKTAENAKNIAVEVSWRERNGRKDAEEERDAAQDEARQARNERDAAVDAVAILLHVSEPEARERIREMQSEKREKEIQESKRESEKSFAFDENLELIEPEEERRGWHR